MGDNDSHIEGKAAKAQRRMRGKADCDAIRGCGGGGGGHLRAVFKITQVRFFESRKCILVVSALPSPSI